MSYPDLVAPAQMNGALSLPMIPKKCWTLSEESNEIILIPFRWQKDRAWSHVMSLWPSLQLRTYLWPRNSTVEPPPVATGPLGPLLTGAGREKVAGCDGLENEVEGLENVGWNRFPPPKAGLLLPLPKMLNCGSAVAQRAKARTKRELIILLLLVVVLTMNAEDWMISGNNPHPYIPWAVAAAKKASICVSVRIVLAGVRQSRSFVRYCVTLKDCNATGNKKDDNKATSWDWNFTLKFARILVSTRAF